MKKHRSLTDIFFLNMETAHGWVIWADEILSDIHAPVVFQRHRKYLFEKINPLHGLKIRYFKKAPFALVKSPKALFILSYVTIT